MGSSREAAFGVIGLGVMGRNLALNIEEHDFSVAVWNLEKEATQAFVKDNAGKRFTATYELDDFVNSLERPRRILMMIKAGDPVDQMLAKLKPMLEKGDIVIDGGNSWFLDTRRREADYAAAGLNFVGMGVSGGEEGARHGPSLMPGGTKEAWERLKPILQAIAAKTDSGPCVTHCGPDGAGHFVKMVHNGIEYGDMQLIAEVYDVLHRGCGMDVDQLADLFAAWNKTELESFLVEITATIFKKRDEKTGRPLVDVVLDSAGQKGTGRLTVTLALDLGVAVPTIAAAVDARVLSSLVELRRSGAGVFGARTEPKKPSGNEVQKITTAAREALLLGRICSYAQGLHLIQAGSDEYKWGIDLQEMARIWKGGCIIRSALLDLIRRAYDGPKPAHLLLAAEVRTIAARSQGALREFVTRAAQLEIPTPALSASLSYFDALKSAQLPQNLTQAQRDAFGAHTYVRTDDPTGKAVHSEWLHT